MPSLAEEIRAFVDSGIRPVSADEARRYMATRPIGASNAGGQSPQAPVRRPRRPRRPGAAVLTLAAAVVLLLVLLLPAAAPRARQSSAQAALETAARHAASAAVSLAAGEELSVREDFLVDGVFRPASGAAFDYQLPGTDTWYMDRSGTGQERLQLGAAAFPSVADRAAWQAAGSPTLGADLQLTEPLPLSPAQSQTQQNQHGVGAAPTQPTVIPYDRVQALSSEPGPLERQLIAEFESGYADPAQTLDLAATILEEGATGAQRRALYEMVAALPGVVGDGSVTTDLTHQRGVGVSITEGGCRSELIFDPETSAVLEERWTPLSPQASAVPTTIGGPTSVNEQALAYVVYRSIQTLPASPTA